MSLILIKLRKEWFSNNNMKMCNHDIQFLGQERHVLRQHNAGNKEETMKKKICNNDLHFSGQEWEYYPLNEGEREERE